MHQPFSRSRRSCRERCTRAWTRPQRNNAGKIRAGRAWRQKAVLFHPDCYRRLRIRTESADPGHGRSRADGRTGVRRITAGGDLHPALRNTPTLPLSPRPDKDAGRHFRAAKNGSYLPDQPGNCKSKNEMIAVPVPLRTCEPDHRGGSQNSDRYDSY